MVHGGNTSEMPHVIADKWGLVKVFDEMGARTID
jgi:hypothetical protein